MFSCHRLLGLLCSKVGHVILNVHNDVSALCSREGETGTDESAHGLTGKN